jgi:MFS family permease
MKLNSQSFIFADLLAILSGILVIIQYTETLLLGRFIQGLTVGFISSLVPIMIKEFSPN